MSKKNNEQKEVLFQLFWDKFDKKVGRKGALKKWLKLNDEDIDLILAHVPLYIRSTPNKKFRKNPETYINQESWHDEIIVNEEPKKNDIKDDSVLAKFKKLR